MKKTKLSIDEILNVKFKKKFIGGLNSQSVDDFLNLVIDDYEYFEEQLINLKASNEELRKENFKVKMNVLNQNSDKVDLVDEITQTPDLKNKDSSLRDLEKRIIELEKEVAVINAKIAK